MSFYSLTSMAGEADVIAVKAIESTDGTYSFDVTVQHADAGWDHYADKWQIVAPDGTLLATRTLAHPHVNEQPFTRSLGGISIPVTVKQVVVRAGDSVHGLGGMEVTVDVN